ncbi:MAG TPA: hypothetical protein VMV02_04295 [Acidimicrobiales bacterium]|nr:hypothetical protein [Acidimicrobiales bacterium]
MPVSTTHGGARTAVSVRDGRGTRAPRSARRTLDRPDLVALGALALLPILLYVPLALAGHALLPGDDLTQNYPLRVLSGELIRSGQLPAWNPYIWSGTPLVAGWNAGALFPGTWLFAVLPGVAAWTLNLVAVGVTSGTGTYLLLRRLGCGPLAGVLGALAFTDTGFMSGQIVHVGLVQGTSLLPWMLLSVEVLAAPARGRVLRARPAPAGAATGTSPGEAVARGAWPSSLELRWSALLALSTALTVLAGDPRAVSSSAIAVGLYVLAWCWRLGRSSARLVACAIGAAALGVALAAAQWLPGLAFLHGSQRGVSAFTFFEGGSLALTEIGALLALPFALGGNGNFGLATYAGNYNLPEVTIGVGIVALVAAFALLPDALAPVRAVISAHGRRAGRPSTTGRPLGVWYLTGIVGTVLTLGSNTPLAHALVHIPLFGGERLQNRNVVLLDLALVVVLAFFVDDLSDRRRALRAKTRPRTAPGPLDTLPRRALALVPVVGTCTMVVLAFAAPTALEDAIGVVTPDRGLMSALTPYLAASAAVALALGALVAAWSRIAPRTRHALLVAFVVADVVTYLANASYAGAPAGALATNGPSTAALRALLGPDGRFAIFNPQYGGTGTAAYSLGVTDLNVLRHLPSVQGYGSIVQGSYQNATNTHAFQALDASRLAGSTFDVLDLDALVTLPTYLEQPLPERGPIPLPGRRAVRADGTPVAARDAPAPQLLATGPWTVGRRSAGSWYLASASAVASVTVVLAPSGAATHRTIDVGLAAPTGPVRWRAVPVSHGIATLRTSDPVASARVAVRPLGGAAVVDAVVVTTTAPRQRLLLDGQLQGLVTAPHWRWAATIGPFVVLADARSRGAAWLEAPGATSPDAPIARTGTTFVTASPTTGSEVVHVDAPRPVTLVRSMTFARGWTARFTPVGGGPSRVERVGRLGLVEAVPVPAGRYVVTWRYSPASMRTGLLISAAAAVVLALALAEASRRRGEASGRRPPRDARR